MGSELKVVKMSGRSKRVPAINFVPLNFMLRSSLQHTLLGVPLPTHIPRKGQAIRCNDQPTCHFGFHSCPSRGGGYKASGL
jgi:hypothetical protein